MTRNTPAVLQKAAKFQLTQMLQHFEFYFPEAQKNPERQAAMDALEIHLQRVLGIEAPKVENPDYYAEFMEVQDVAVLMGLHEFLAEQPLDTDEHYAEIEAAGTAVVDMVVLWHFRGAI